MKDKKGLTHKQMIARVRAWCNKNRLNPQDASIELGLSRQYLSRCIKGERKFPSEVLSAINDQASYICVSETVWTYFECEKGDCYDQ